MEQEKTLYTYGVWVSSYVSIEVFAEDEDSAYEEVQERVKDIYEKLDDGFKWHLELSEL